MPTWRVQRLVAAGLSLLLAIAVALPALAAERGGLQSLTGESIGAAELARGKVILVVWASWSPRCRDIVPRINAIARRWSGQAAVMAVNFQEEPAEVSRFLTGQGLSARVAIDRDSSFAKKHGITWLPGLVVLDEGRSLYGGKLPDDPDSLLASLLSR
ncbi:MAG TPA: TlpA disulfide reductase family protein [Thermoanaerobaculia bacterium]|nr:TlpA disulfide reductase family protein [Thermoanaerobaculia bacterium]